MREFTGCQVEDPGAVPGASNNSTIGNEREKRNTTELSSVEIANRLSLQGGNDQKNRGISGGPAVQEFAPAVKPDFPGVGDLVRFNSGACRRVVRAGVVRGLGGRWFRVDEDGMLSQTYYEDQQDGQWWFPAGAVWSGDASNEGAKPEEAPCSPRTCGVQGCDCILGEDVEGDLCAVHRRAADEVNKCARRGCGRARAFGETFCPSHAKCAASVTLDNVPAIPEEAEQPNDKPKPSPDWKAYARKLSGELFEDTWQRMAEDSGNDPVTVARCKIVHDMQLRDLLGVLS